MFVNYYKSETRSSPINLAYARVVLGVYVLWRGSSVDTRSMTEWPHFVWETTAFLYPPEGLEFLLHIEKVLLILFSVSFIIGYRTRLSAFIMALTMTHFASLKMLYQFELGETQQMMIGALLVLLFALYSEHDKVSVDAIRKTKKESLQALNNRLQKQHEHNYQLTGLKWSLVTIGILYFGAGWIKVIDGPLFEWAEAISLARWMEVYQNYFDREFIVAQLLVESEFLLAIANWLTLVVEVGLIFAVLAGIAITPIIVILFGFHVTVLVATGIFFLDVMIFLSIFFAFDNIYGRMSTNESIEVVYDEHCYFCARSLSIFRWLDINQTISFYSQYSVPKKHNKHTNINFESQMYVFADGEYYGGYYAFRRLLQQFWITVPISWLMRLPPIARAGEVIYQYIAKNRDRHFTCDYNDGEN